MDVDNYINPIVSYISQVGNLVFSIYTAHVQVDFKLMNLLTQSGLVFDSNINITSIQSSGNQMQMLSSTDSSIVQFNILATNMVDYYNRSYLRIQDVAASCGGIIKLIFIINQLIKFKSPKMNLVEILKNHNTQTIDLQIAQEILLMLVP